MNNSLDTFYRYWGKVCPSENTEVSYHLLPYHCLDVAAVAWVWLEQNKALRTRIVCLIGIERQLDNIVGFFLALHDLGKFDIRFQSQVPEVRNIVWHNLNPNDLFLTQNNIAEYKHGKAGYEIFVKFYEQFLGLGSQECSPQVWG